MARLNMDENLLHCTDPEEVAIQFIHRPSNIEVAVIMVPAVLETLHLVDTVDTRMQVIPEIARSKAQTCREVLAMVPQTYHRAQQCTCVAPSKNTYM